MEDSSTLFNVFSDLSDIDKASTMDEFADDIMQKVTPILEDRFRECIPKQKPSRKHGRISIACPYCGDSMKNDYAKRGNFILSGKYIGMYKCHNCGMYKRIDSFFSDFNTLLSLENVNFISSVAGKFEHTGDNKYDVSYLLDTEWIERIAIDREEYKKQFGLIEVDNSSIIGWLDKRMQYDHSKFLYDAGHSKLLILNNTPGGKILGLQRRLFNGPSRFETESITKMYEHMGKSMEEGMDWDYLDTLSMVFNITTVDIRKPITVLEGPMDSFMLKNAIANTGANKGLPIDIPVKYWYDFDKTGIKRSIEYIGKGNYVFLWSKLISEYQLPYREKWDLNDLIVYLKQHSIRIPNFQKYFSNDPFDVIDV